jgi:hypothetical protein
MQIAHELAMDILSPAQIQKIYKLSEQEWAQLVADPRFDAMLQDAIGTWQSAKNIETRIKFKALASVEMSLLRFHTDMNDPEITLTARTEALKTVMKLAGIDKPEPATQGGGGWSLQINIGPQTFSVSPVKEPPTIEGSPA